MVIRGLRGGLTSAFGRYDIAAIGRAEVETMASADSPEIRELREEIRQLRSLVVSLSAALLRKVAVESETRRPPDSGDAQRLVQEAEDCFRCARIPGLKSEIAEGLEAAGRELEAKAVEIETELYRARRKP